VQGFADGVLTLSLEGSPAAAVPILQTLATLYRHHVPAVREVRLAAGTAAAQPTDAGADDDEGRVRRVIDERINPAVAAHGGRIVLDAAREGSVYLRMEGRCQGCAMAEVTLRQGIEPMLREAWPDMLALVDTTDHPSGSDPFFKTRKGPA